MKFSNNKADMIKFIKVYGERNTNTNYLSKLLELNLDVCELPGTVPYLMVKALEYFPWQEAVKDFYFNVTYPKNLGWKHACVKKQEELNNYELVKNGLAFITITKNPYSWLLSLYRMPYHGGRTKGLSFEEFLRRPWRTVGRENTIPLFKNPVELWNVKNASYLCLDKDKALNITSEMIFINAESVLNDISDKFSINKKSENFVNYEKSTKNKNRDSGYYRDYYLNEKWREKLSADAIGIINESLDKQLMSQYGYSVIE